MFVNNKFALHQTFISFMGIIMVCFAGSFDIRIDMVPPCNRSINNPAYFGPMHIIRLTQNIFQLNGSLIVKETIGGPLEVSIRAYK